MTISKQFVTAGDATFTIEVPPSAGQKDHYTYKVEYVPANERWAESYFVKLLTGPDNTKDFAYLGKLDLFTGQVRTTAKSQRFEGSFPLRLVNRILARVWTSDHNAYEQHGYQTHHEGKCGRCGRKLTVPQSILTGIGPECCKVMGIEMAPTEAPAKPKRTRKAKTPTPRPMSLGERADGPGGGVMTMGGFYTGD